MASDFMACSSPAPYCSDAIAVESRGSTGPQTLVGGWSGALLLVLAALIGLNYWSTATELVAIWSNDPNYSHGFAVPFFCLFLAWSASKQAGGPCQASVGRSETCRGFLKVALGLGLHVVASFLGHSFLDVVALICLVRGSILVLGGNAAHQNFGLAALFLIFMARLPISWYQLIARHLQDFVCMSSAQFFELCGIPIYREGYSLHMPGQTLQVGEACSGMRQLTTALALGVIIGYFFTKRNLYIWMLAVAAIPTAVVANCLRVVMAGFALRWFGPKWAEGILHTVEGVTTMALVSVLLLGLALALSHWDASRKTPNATAH